MSTISSSENQFVSDETDEDDEIPSTSTDNSRVQPKPIWHYRKFKCSFNGCEYQCSKHRQFSAHLETHECPFCAKYFLDVASHKCRFDGQYHKQYGMGSIEQDVFKLQLPPAHKGVMQTYNHDTLKPYISLHEMFIDLNGGIVKLLKQSLDKRITIKVQFKVLVDLENVKTKAVLPDIWLSTGFFRITHPNFIKNYIKFFLNYLENTLEIWNQNESGYSLSSINMLQIRIGKYEPLSGGVYLPLPKELKRKKGSLVNIDSSLYYCFHYCIAAAFHSKQAFKYYKNKTRIIENRLLTSKERKVALSDSDAYIPFLKNFNFEGLRKPVPIEDIDIFESNNNISVNCYGLRDRKIISLRITIEEKARHVDLLLIQYEGEGHYLLISDISSFLGRTGARRHIFCKYCLRRFEKKHTLNNHMAQCLSKRQQTIRYPKEDFYQFQNMHETLRFPYVLYYDFETFSAKINQSCGRNTRFTGLITPAQYSLILVGPKGFECAKIYDGPDVGKDFLISANTMADKVKKFLKDTNNRTPLTQEDKVKSNNIHACELCQAPFTEKNIKISHHNHVTGEHLYFVCHTCNMKARTQYIIPILSHGGTNFDHHLVMKGMTKGLVKKLKIIPQSGQKFMGFVMNNKLKFMDSCKFMPGKLSALAKALLKDGETGFLILFQYFRQIKEGEPFYKPQGYSDSEIRLLLGKQSFPYELLTDESVFNLTALPPIEKFRNNLKMKDLKPCNYEHALLVWKTFCCNTFKDYSRLYCIVDTLILACVMETHRRAAFDIYGLEMLHKWSAPGFSYSAGMFSSKAKLQYIKDDDMVNMIRGSIRGGPCFCNTRLFKANNERIGNFDKTKPRTHIFYADLKSLYPSCLINSMPIDSFEWLTSSELESLDVLNLPEDSGIGYIIECDLEYGKHLHDCHNDLPLAPEKMYVTLNDISGTQHNIMKAHRGSEILNKMSVEKLVLTLHDKENYVSYYKTLKFYLKQGLKIKGNIKRCIRFREGPIFLDYIGGTLAKRESERSEVLRIIYKLIANSFYGKMLQSSSKFKDVILCTSRAYALHLIAKPEFNEFYEIGPDISIFVMDRKNPTEDSLFCIAFVVLELAKLRLMQVHYDGVKSVFGDRCSIAYSDTDSAIYLINDPLNTYIDDLKSLSWLFDYSNMKEHELYDTTNVGIPGMFKMEAMDITEFCGLSAKLYSLKLNDNNSEKKAKGVSKAVVKHSLTHEDYVQVVEDMTKLKYVDMNLIRSRNHQLYNQTVRKIALNALDFKRFLLPNGIDTLSLGHYRISDMNKNSDF